jgi:protein-S-isoprenylcysteine O-methyltransferase Ste14
MMQTEMVFRLTTLFVLVAAIAISVTFRHRAEREGGAMRTDEGKGLVRLLRLLGLFVLTPLIGYVIHPQWVTWARFDLPEGIRWLAAAVALGILPILFWIFSSIGNNISPTQTTRTQHQLVTHGPYRWVRHPLYSCGLLLMLALTLITGLWWLAVTMLPPLMILLWRTSAEEAYLVEAFGDDYRAYMRQTGRFWPRISGSV